MLNQEVKSNVRTRLKRVEGQIAGLLRMVDSDAYCVDVLVQISAAQGALGAIGQVVLANHIRTCVSEAFQHGSESDRQKKVDELMDVFGRYSRIGAR